MTTQPIDMEQMASSILMPSIQRPIKRRVLRILHEDRYRYIFTFRSGRLRSVLKEYHGRFVNLAKTGYGPYVYDTILRDFMQMGVTLGNLHAILRALKAKEEKNAMEYGPIGSPRD